jgi:3-oxoacyl-[acyl-carrier protein] reductase
MDATLAGIERGHGLIRVLFNNAGAYDPGKDWLDEPPDQFDDTMTVNVRVPFFASQWVAKRLIAAGEPSAIVTAASAPASAAALWQSMVHRRPPSST